MATPLLVETEMKQEPLATRKSHWRASIGTFLLTVSKVVDEAYSLFDGLREELVLFLGSDEFMRRYNDYIYGRHTAYSSGEHGFRPPFLWEWEETAVREFFPPPPARLLVGGAGAGREAIALAERGYEVTAFECAPPLLRGMRDEAQRLGQSIEMYRGRYEDLFEEAPGAASSDPDEEIPQLPLAEALGEFHGVILGWGSMIHLYHPEDRRRLLQTCGTLCPSGPVLLSFVEAANEARLNPGVGRSRRYPVWSSGDSAPNSWWQNLRKRMRRRQGRSANDAFWVHYGMGHLYTRQEIHDLAHEAGFSVVSYQTIMEAGWDHAVLAPRPSMEAEAPGAESAP